MNGASLLGAVPLEMAAIMALRACTVAGKHGVTLPWTI